MGGGIGSFVEGLAGGVQQGQKQAMARELQDMQMTHLKTSNKAAELALKMEQMKGGIFETLTPEEKRAALFPKVDETLEGMLSTIGKFNSGGGAAQVPLPDYVPGEGMPPFRPGATMTVPQTIAQGQVGGGDFFGMSKEDLVRGVIKKKLGAEPMKYSRTAPVIMPDGNPGTAPIREDGFIDVSKAVPAPFKLDTQKGVGEGMAPIETPINPYNRAPVGAPVQTGPPPTRVVESPTVGGGATSNVVPLFPGVVGSTVTGTPASGGPRTKLDLMDLPIAPDEVSKWTDGAGKNPPPGWTPRQAQARGFKPAFPAISGDAAGKGLMISQALSDLEVVEKLLFPKPGVFNRTLALGARGNIPEWAVKDSQIVMSNMQNAVNAKLRIETGAQANPSETENIMARFFPSGIKDNEASARNKVRRLKDFMERGKFVLDPQGKLVIVEPPKKPDLSLGKKKDPGAMSDAELLKALQ
jgi:hypothetical protein